MHSNTWASHSIWWYYLFLKFIFCPIIFLLTFGFCRSHFLNPLDSPWVDSSVDSCQTGTSGNWHTHTLCQLNFRSQKKSGCNSLPHWIPWYQLTNCPTWLFETVRWCLPAWARVVLWGPTSGRRSAQAEKFPIKTAYLYYYQQDRIHLMDPLQS